MMSCVLLLLIGQLVISSVKTDPRVPVKIISDKEVQVADVRLSFFWGVHATSHYKTDTVLYINISEGAKKYRVYISEIRINGVSPVIAGDPFFFWGDPVVTVLPRSSRYFWIAPVYAVDTVRYEEISGGYLCDIARWFEDQPEFTVKLPLYYDNDNKVLMVNIILKNQFKQKRR